MPLAGSTTIRNPRTNEAMKEEIKIQRAIDYLKSKGYGITPPAQKNEKKEDPNLLLIADYPLYDAMAMWIEYKRERRQSYKPRGLQVAMTRLMQLSNGDPETAKAIVEQSMANNYQGLFPIRQANGTDNRTQQRQDKLTGTLGRIQELFNS